MALLFEYINVFLGENHLFGDCFVHYLISCIGRACVVANKNTLETVQYGVEGSTTFLECQARSPHMVLKWHLQKENSDRRKEVRASKTK